MRINDELCQETREILKKATSAKVETTINNCRKDRLKREKRAKQLVKKHIDITNPHQKNPITTIFELVETLNAHIKK